MSESDDLLKAALTKYASLWAASTALERAGLSFFEEGTGVNADWLAEVRVEAMDVLDSGEFTEVDFVEAKRLCDTGVHERSRQAMRSLAVEALAAKRAESLVGATGAFDRSLLRSVASELKADLETSLQQSGGPHVIPRLEMAAPDPAQRHDVASVIRALAGAPRPLELPGNTLG